LVRITQGDYAVTLYDAWANLTAQAPASGYGGCTGYQPQSYSATAANQLSGFNYDTSGNTLWDGVYSYTWDGESQLQTAGGVTYSYDGSGRRAAKVGGKLYWYGSGGEVLAETDASGNVQNEYVYFGGHRVAMLPTGGAPIYYAEDMLGSSRVIVTNSGAVCYDADFYPFGGERAVVNSCAQNYKFEGKERDAETQNDDFGAREYSWRAGRWLSADWSAIPAPVPYANLSNPQTLNLYAMVADDPETFADLNGHNALERLHPGSGMMIQAARNDSSC
jgi:RHS repeat-associated protein